MSKDAKFGHFRACIFALLVEFLFDYSLSQNLFILSLIYLFISLSIHFFTRFFISTKSGTNGSTSGEGARDL